MPRVTTRRKSIAPPSQSEQDEVAAYESLIEASRLKQLPTSKNEGLDLPDIADLAISDFLQKEHIGRFKLRECVKNNDYEWVYLLLYEAEKKHVSWMTLPLYGVSPWNYACQLGSLRTLKEMIKFPKLDKLTLTSDGGNSLYNAVCNGHIHVVKWLLERRDIQGNVLTSIPVYDIDSQTLEGKTSLWMAAFNGDKTMVQLLINYGCNALKLSNPNRQEKVRVKNVEVDDVVLLLPNLERCVVISVDGSIVKTIDAGDKVVATYRGSEKVYIATVVEVNRDDTYDLKYHDGAFESGVKKIEVTKVDGSVGVGENNALKNKTSKSGPLPPIDAADVDNADNIKTKKQPTKTKPQKQNKNTPCIVRLINPTSNHTSSHPTTTQYLKPCNWLGTRASECARARGFVEVAGILEGEEGEIKKDLKGFFKLVGRMTVGLIGDEKKRLRKIDDGEVV